MYVYMTNARRKHQSKGSTRDFCYTRKRTQSTRIHYKIIPDTQYEKASRSPKSASPFRLSHSSNRGHSFNVLIASRPPLSSGCLAEDPSEAGSATLGRHTLAEVIATRHRCYHLCWPRRHSMMAADCCCCCSRAVGSAVLGIGSGFARIARIAAGCCRLLGRGQEVCDRESSRCRGKAGSRAFCDDER